MKPREIGMVIVVCCAIGAGLIAGTLATGRGGAAGVLTPGSEISATEDYGKRLLFETTVLMGPDVADPKMRYTGNRLACASCHINAGTEPGNLSLMTAISKYPRISPRSGQNETIEERINGCMMRSMNGRALPEDSLEMKAMVAYLRFLGREDAAMSAARKKSPDPPAFKTPGRAANLQAGQKVFEQRCTACHGADGAGLQASAKITDGFVFPPVWGPNSFNDGAGLHRVLTAARFIKARMPLGRPDLTDDEAFDVAAYVNSKPRPEMANLDRDYPDRSKKPVDTSYGPYGDSFPLSQHQFGPFGPIEAFYKKK